MFDLAKASDVNTLRERVNGLENVVYKLEAETRALTMERDLALLLIRDLMGNTDERRKLSPEKMLLQEAAKSGYGKYLRDKNWVKGNGDWFREIETGERHHLRYEHLSVYLAGICPECGK